MSSSVISGFLVAFTLAPSALAAEAEAEAEAERYRVEFRVIGESQVCPERAAFLKGVRHRTQKWIEDETSAKAIVIELVDKGPRGTQGELSVVREERVVARRAVVTKDCSEAARALALVFALYVDPQAEELPPPTEAPVPAAVDARTRPEPGEGRGGRRPAPVVTRRWLVGVGVGARSSVGPGLAPTLRVAVGMQADGYIVEVAAEGAKRLSSVRGDLGSASFDQGVVSLLACVSRSLLGALSIGGCATVEAGVFRGTGSEIPNARAQSAFWLAPGVGVATRWLAGANVFFDATGALLLPLGRPEFYFERNDTLFRVQPIAFKFVISSGLAF